MNDGGSQTALLSGAAPSRKDKNRMILGAFLALALALLVGAAVGSLIAIFAIGSKTTPRFLLVDVAGKLVVPTWACKSGSVCDRNSLAARSYQSGLFAVSWTPGHAPDDIEAMVDAVWEWRNGALVHYATGHSVVVGGPSQVGGTSSTSEPLSLALSSSPGAKWQTSLDSLGRVSFTGSDGTRLASAVSGDASPAVLALPTSASSNNFSLSFNAVPWALA